MRVGINAMILGKRDTGVGIFLRGLIRALARFDRENEYLVYHGLDSGVIDTAGARNFTLVPIKLRNACRFERIAWEQFVLPARAGKDGLHVLHAPVYVKPYLLKIPSVLTVHDLFAFTHPVLCKRLNVVHYRLTVPSSVRSAQVIHCLSNWVREEVVKRWPAAAPKLELVYPGIDDLFSERAGREIAGAVREKYEIASDLPFLFVGNIEPKKNLPLIFDALRLLDLEFGSRRELVVVGRRGWKWRGALRRCRDLGLSDRVRFCGYVEREELPAFYTMALALVFPSICEGFGLPPLEAMRCGTPVIVSDAPALLETAGNSSLVCARDDPRRLAAQMHKLETDSVFRARLAQTGYKQSLRFSWEGCAEGMVGLYREAARK